MGNGKWEMGNGKGRMEGRGWRVEGRVEGCRGMRNSG